MAVVERLHVSDIPEILVVYPSPGVAVVECTGEHDLVTRDEIKWLLNSLLDRNELVVIDLSEALYIDSSMIHNILMADKKARKDGKRFRLQVSTAPIVHRVLEMTAVLKTIPNMPTREEALAP